MTFFESMLLLLLIAILLLQVSRRLAIPYPTMLAAAGLALAMVPGAPVIGLDPHLALALFIAPALLDAGFDFPLAAVKSLWRPLLALAVGAVLVTTAAVAGLGVALAGLPLYAAVALGAIVAPPDAAAATAVLGSVNMPGRSVTVLRGESLLNDATALLLFTAAVAFHSREVDGALVLQLGLAAPGGVLLGIAFGYLFLWVRPFVTGTLGGNLLEFVMTFGAWIIAERLHLSAVLCLVALALTIARPAALETPPRMRIQSFATWDSAVFLLNVFAFLLMGMQARTIVGAMEPERLREAAWFAGAVVLCLVTVRMAWVIGYNRLAWHISALRGSTGERATFGQSVLIGWAGMRGLVTLATAFALPETFPQRDLIVLTAFAVVLATLVVQGLTLAPLVRLLGLDRQDPLGDELARGRAALASAGLAALESEKGPMADHWRFSFETARAAATPPADCRPLEEKRRLGLFALHRQRERLDELRREETVGPDAFLVLQEELDFAEVALNTESERRIEAN